MVRYPPPQTPAEKAAETRAKMAPLKDEIEELHEEIKTLKAENRHLKAELAAAQKQGEAQNSASTDEAKELESLRQQQAERDWRAARGLP